MRGRFRNYSAQTMFVPYGLNQGSYGDSAETGAAIGGLFGGVGQIVAVGIQGSQAKKQREHQKDMAKLKAQNEAKLAPGRAALAAEEARLAEAHAAATEARSSSSTTTVLTVGGVITLVIFGLGGAYFLTRPKKV